VNSFAMSSLPVHFRRLGAPSPVLVQLANESNTSCIRWIPDDVLQTNYDRVAGATPGFRLPNLLAQDRAMRISSSRSGADLWQCSHPLHFHRFDRQFLGAIGSHQNAHRRLGSDLARVISFIPSSFGRRNQSITRQNCPLQQLHGGSSIFGDVNVVTIFQRGAQSFPRRLFVVDDKQCWLFRSGHYEPGSFFAGSHLPQAPRLALTQRQPDAEVVLVDTALQFNPTACSRTMRCTIISPSRSLSFSSCKMVRRSD